MSAFIDHELDAESSLQLESHLQRCVECRKAIDELRVLNGMVLELPRIEPGPDYASEMVFRVRKISTAPDVKRQGRLSLFRWLSRVAEDFMDMMTSSRSKSPGTLDEFNDFPPHSMGYIYFRLISVRW